MHSGIYIYIYINILVWCFYFRRNRSSCIDSSIGPALIKQAIPNIQPSFTYLWYRGIHLAAIAMSIAVSFGIKSAFLKNSICFLISFWLSYNALSEWCQAILGISLTDSGGGGGTEVRVEVKADSLIGERVEFAREIERKIDFTGVER